MANWIDFKELRQRLSFTEVLKHYDVQAKVKGERAAALCPLPGHPARVDGGARTPSLSIHLGRGIFQCFGCKASGNVLDFCIRMDGSDPSDPAQFRTAALKVAERFGLGSQCPPGPARGRKPDGGARPSPVTESAGKVKALPVVINAPLDFELKHLDAEHAYLSGRGFTPETIREFGLGYCAKGLMKGRVAIPIHDADGQLVGYAGRIADDGVVDEATPKYLFPGPRERDGKCYEFHKSHLLYNLHRLDQPVEDLIVVEGFASVWWLTQHGYRHCVGLLGSSCSPEQSELIRAFAERVWVLSDGDDAGHQCAASVWEQLGSALFCRRVPLEAGQQPTDLSGDELAALLPS